MNKLFICSYGQIRSVTAVNLYGGKFLGVSNRYHERLFNEYIDWADEIYIFEDQGRVVEFNTKMVRKLYPHASRKIKQSLWVPDNYGKVNHPELIKRIKAEMEKRPHE